MTLKSRSICNELLCAVVQAVARAEKKKVGDPFDESTEQGPQISRGQFEKILDYVKKGEEEGQS